MSRVIVDKQDIVNIADAIREKTNQTKSFSIKELTSEVRSIGGSNTGGNESSLETCTVKLYCPANYNIVYTKVVDGQSIMDSYYLPVELTDSMANSLGVTQEFSKIQKGSYLLCGVGSPATISVSISIIGNAECANATTQPGFKCGTVFKINGDCEIRMNVKS